MTGLESAVRSANIRRGMRLPPPGARTLRVPLLLLSLLSAGVARSDDAPLTIDEAVRLAVTRNERALASGERLAAAEARVTKARAFFFPDVEVSGACLEVEPERGAALLAVSAGLSRGPADGGDPRTLVARRAESLWLSLGRPVRWTVDSSWDGGRAAIVVELTLLRLGEAPR